MTLLRIIKAAQRLGFTLEHFYWGSVFWAAVGGMVALPGRPQLDADNREKLGRR